MGAGQAGHLEFVPSQCFELKAVLKSCQGQGCFYRTSTGFPFLTCNSNAREKRQVTTGRKW